MSACGRARLPRLSRAWMALYAFAALWLLVLLTQDASHFGPGFFPLVASIVLVPVLMLVFVADFVHRLADAIQGSGSSWARRLWPLAVAPAGLVAYATLLAALYLR